MRPDAATRDLLLAFARLANADWTVLRRHRRTFEVRTGRDPRAAVRGFDAGLLLGVDRGKLVRLEGKALRRSPRTAGAGMSAVLVFVHPERSSDRIVAGLSQPLTVDPRRIEAFARAFVLEAEHVEAEREGAEGFACATHDLRQLLTVASLEIERARLDPGGAEAAERAHAALEDARSLCEHTLVPERPRRRTGAHALRDLLEAAVRDASLASERAGRVEIRVACDPGLARPLDRELFARALRNLLLNAIEASPDGASVELAASSDGGGHLLVSVRDRGRGIALSDLPELLLPGRSGSGGRGLGTESVRACVRELGGELEIRTRPLAGAEFLLRIPRVERDG